MTHADLGYFSKVFDGIFDLLHIKLILASIVTFSCWVFNNDFDAVVVVYVLMVVDCILGISKALKKKELLRSRGIYQTCVKFTIYSLMLMTGELVDKNVGFVFASKIIEVFLTCTEAISILENIKDLGFNVPSSIIDKLKAYKDK